MYGRKYLGIERSAFLIDEQGKVANAWYKVSPADTPKNLLAALLVIALPQPADVLPHRPPFLFVDEVTRLEPGTAAAGTWTLTGDEWFFAGHFPGRPTLPGVLMCEAIAQVGAIAVLTDERFAGKLPLFGGLDGARFRRQVAPGDTLWLEVELARMSARAGKGTGRALVGGSDGELACSASCSSSSSTRERRRPRFASLGSHRPRRSGRRVRRHRHAVRLRAAAVRRPRRDGARRLCPRDRRFDLPEITESPDVPASASAVAGGARVGSRRPLSRRLGRQPPAAALRRHGAADLAVERPRPPRRRADAAAPGQHRLRRRRRRRSPTSSAAISAAESAASVSPRRRSPPSFRRGTRCSPRR